jgi:hypothetical protein
MKNINRIFLLGDSWIEGQGTYSEFNENENLVLTEPTIPFGEDKGFGKDDKTISGWRKKNSWNLFFKEKYGLADSQIINYGSQGSDNYTMFEIFNKRFTSFIDTDLILFGFTSKYRDNSRAINFSFGNLINNNNPILSQLSFEKQAIFGEENGRINKEHLSGLSKIEREVSEEYMRDHLISVFDETVHENIAQSNYLFYEKWCKAHGINILFFDLFESYVDKKFVNELYEVDKTKYITYNDKSYWQKLVDYELENYRPDTKYSIWECGHTFPCKFEYANEGKSKKLVLKNGYNDSKIWHPNQHGYKVMFDDITINHVDTKYKLTPQLI